MSARALVCSLVVASVLSGCVLFDESLLDTFADAGVGCMPKVPPEAPAPAGDEDIGPVYFVLRDVMLQQLMTWEQNGYDLDGLCTREPDRERECLAPGGTTAPDDGAGGVDNVMGQTVFPRFVILAGGMIMLEPPLNARAELGVDVNLLRVEHWNGRDDDDRVDVAFIRAPFGTPPMGDGSAPPLPAIGTLPPPPAWDGRDYFWGDRASFLAGDEASPFQEDTAAYVAGRVLVTHPPDRTPFVLAAESHSLPVVLTNAVLTGAISADSSRLSSVVLAGRWQGTDFLGALSDADVCIGTELFVRAMAVVDMEMDLLATPGMGGPGATCQALSTGVGLTGYRVQWAGLADPGPIPTGCP